ncbi:MAG TPA: hypothetical protein PL152_00580 [Steroidobacteraceae bacterium]|nr:hypothetical protein [Steroidobacteraceae bacterium]HQR47794.1 hypothetical protein [Steroidobacteraceae bacterium]
MTPRSIREFAAIDPGREAIPGETTVCRFRLPLERHQLGPQILATVNAHLKRSGIKISAGAIVDVLA